MDYNLFKEELLLAIQDLVDPEQSVSLHCIDKNNGSCADAVIIMKKGGQIAPTFYLDDFIPGFVKAFPLSALPGGFLNSTNSISRRLRLH